MARHLIPNSTQIPDILLDRFMAVLSGAEFKVLMYIARRTYGFGRDSAPISLNQIAGGIVKRDGTRLDSGTGASRSSVARSLKVLEEMGLVIRTNNINERVGDYDENSYSINLEWNGDDGFNPNDPGEEPVDPTPGGEGPRPERKQKGVVSKSDYPHSKGDQGWSQNETTGGLRIGLGVVSKSDSIRETVRETERETATTAVAERKTDGDLAVAFSPSALGKEREELTAMLQAEGFSAKDAKHLSSLQPQEVIHNQLRWISKRTVKANRLGMLRRAIEENWPEPETTEETKRREAAEQRKARQEAEEARRRKIEAGLREMYSRLPSDAPDAFTGFCQYVEAEKERQSNRPLIRESPRRLEWFRKSFDTDERRIQLMVEYFKEREVPIEDFRRLFQDLPPTGFDAAFWGEPRPT